MYRKNKNSLIIGLLMLVLLSACGLGGMNDRSNTDDGVINIAATFFPLYDFSKKIGGDHVHVINLVPAGVEPHDWSPRSQEMRTMTRSDIFLYNGAGLEGWVDQFLKIVDTETGPYIQAAIEGVDLITATSSEQHDDHDHDDHGHHHGPSDPHAWLSPLQAQQYAKNILQALITVDPQNRADYEANYAVLAKQLQELDQAYREAAEGAARKDIVVSHQSLAYLARDYGLQQHAIMGISPEAEPTRSQISQLSELIKAFDIKYILLEEMVSGKAAEVLARDLGVALLSFHPLEGVTKSQEAAGESYVSLMQKNLKVLEQALQ